MSGRHLPLHCDSYHAGHEVHWIQARLSRESDPIGKGRATVADDGWITVELDDGEQHRLWHHDPAWLTYLFGGSSGRVTLRSKSVLAASGGHLVSVGDQPSPCPDRTKDTST